MAYFKAWPNCNGLVLVLRIRTTLSHSVPRPPSHSPPPRLGPHPLLSDYTPPRLLPCPRRGSSGRRRCHPAARRGAASTRAARLSPLAGGAAVPPGPDLLLLRLRGCSKDPISFDFFCNPKDSCTVFIHLEASISTACFRSFSSTPPPESSSSISADLAASVSLPPTCSCGGPRELAGAFDLISHYKLLPHHDFFCKKPLPLAISDTHYLHNVVGDTEIRKGEGMELDQLVQNAYMRDKPAYIQPFDMETLGQAFQLRETAPVDLPSTEKGIPTISGKPKSESKDKEKKHKKHKDKDREKDKEHKKHKHRHKDRTKDKDKDKDKDRKKDKSGHHDSGGEHSKKHHEKKRKHEGTEDSADVHKHKKSKE
ncbi:hypothetical protein U9M48_037217 [Paspalum notatum var. saurae]|uniref:Mediator of RNA polymerase II transcription subunit 19a n=1 Tax=Paspalum notatum var. saurae TaxID=547442 RepID=A0AAQ3UF61_PASNO